jgi:Rrf2 family protein
MRLSLRVQYAICASFDLAYSGQGEPVQIRAIAERQAIPPRYLEQIFVRLRRARLVDSKRGPGGGYRLARPAAEITLCEIVEAVEGPLTESLEMSPPETGSNANRPDFIWSGLAERFTVALEATTLDALCRQAAQANLPGGRADEPMYFI